MFAREGRRQRIDEVVIRGENVYAASPEGQTATMELQKLVQMVIQQNVKHMDTSYMLPDGVKLVRSRGPVTILVYERPPQVHNFKWIATSSPVPFGRGTTYREVRIALPYLIVIAVFVYGKRGSVQLSDHNECFFRNHPLKSTRDELCYPALLNCSRFDPPDGRPLSWICTAKLNRRSSSLKQDNEAHMRAGLRALLHCLLETGYNRSSEHHEKSSWFTESIGADKRISTIENWEKATHKDQLFVLNVPWLRTGLTLEQIIERIFGNLKTTQAAVTSASDIQRIVFNHTDTP